MQFIIQLCHNPHTYQSRHTADIKTVSSVCILPADFPIPERPARNLQKIAGNFTTNV